MTQAFLESAKKMEQAIHGAVVDRLQSVPEMIKAWIDLYIYLFISRFC